MRFYEKAYVSLRFLFLLMFFWVGKTGQAVVSMPLWPRA